jgi:hypothetical protein
MDEFIRDSDDFEIDKVFDRKRLFAPWFNDQYIQCKLSIIKEAGEWGIRPEELSYDVRILQDKWDIKFIVTAHKVPSLTGGD